MHEVHGGTQASRDDILTLVHTIKENPGQNRRMYRQLAVSGMVLAGLGSESQGTGGDRRV